MIFIALLSARHRAQRGSDPEAGRMPRHLAVHIIEPAGFPWSEKSLRRAGSTTWKHARILRHASFASFRAATAGGRLVLLSTKARTAYFRFEFREGDMLLFGRETAGVPDEVHRAADVASHHSHAARHALAQRGDSPARWSSEKRSGRLPGLRANLPVSAVERCGSVANRASHV